MVVWYPFYVWLYFIENNFLPWHLCDYFAYFSALWSELIFPGLCPLGFIVFSCNFLLLSALFIHSLPLAFKEWMPHPLFAFCDITYCFWYLTAASWILIWLNIKPNVVFLKAIVYHMWSNNFVVEKTPHRKQSLPYRHQILWSSLYTLSSNFFIRSMEVRISGKQKEQWKRSSYCLDRPIEIFYGNKSCTPMKHGLMEGAWIYTQTWCESWFHFF